MQMEGRKMAFVPFKLWEDMKRLKAEQIQKAILPPDPNVSATASQQRDLSSVLANEDLSEGEKISVVWSDFTSDSNGTS